MLKREQNISMLWSTTSTTQWCKFMSNLFWITRLKSHRRRGEMPAAAQHKRRRFSRTSWLRNIHHWVQIKSNFLSPEMRLCLILVYVFTRCCLVALWTFECEIRYTKNCTTSCPIVPWCTLYSQHTGLLSALTIALLFKPSAQSLRLQHSAAVGARTSRITFF